MPFTAALRPAAGSLAVKVCVIHNEYGKLSGEEVAVRNLKNLLEEKGHSVVPYIRSSAEIDAMHLGRIRAFFSGVYSPKSRKVIADLLEREKADLVHVHNLFPLISPSVLLECKARNIPVVMTVHNYRLICPSGLFAYEGKVCEKCAGGHEYWALFRNCERSILKSTGYGLRNWTARRNGYFRDNVTLYATLTEFQRQKLIAAGFEENRIRVVPNMLNDDYASGRPSVLGSYFGFVGRLSPEKGVDVLLSAAKTESGIPFKIAGTMGSANGDQMNSLSNVEFRGYLEGKRLHKFYEESRAILLASTCYEGFPMVILEAMFNAKPVICPRIGGLSEIVKDGVTGLLFEPGNSSDLAEKVRYLWDRPELCRKLGNAGREKALQEYSPDKYYERIMSAYKEAIDLAHSNDI